MTRIEESIFPEGEGLADDFVQLGLGFAAAEGERAGEMLPIVQRQAVKFAGDEGFQRGGEPNRHYFLPHLLENL